MIEASHTVLIGSAGTGTAFGATRALRRYWPLNVTVVTMDINPRELVTNSLFSDHFHQVPLTASPDFASAVAQIVSVHHVDTYLPLLPEETTLTARLLEAGQLPCDLVCLAGSRMATEIAADKWATAQWLASNGLNGPKTTLASEAVAQGNYFLKPRYGSGSHGARVIEGHDLGPSIQSESSFWVVQEICQTPEVTVDAFYDPDTGFCAAVCRERIEIKSGVTTKARLFHDDALGLISKRIACTLSFAGSFCFQVMRVNGEWGVIDINLRPGAATAMCAVTGNDFFAATFARAWREDYFRFFAPLKHEYFVTRQYTEYVTG